MNRRSLGWAVALVVLAQTGPATAQINLRGSLSNVAIPPASSGSLAVLHADANAGSFAGMAGEPKSMAGMLAAQNEARARVGLPPLVWAPELAARADATVKQAAASCRASDADKIGKAVDASIYWAAGLPRMGGESTAQDILPSYLVAQWKDGRADLDMASGQCRRTGACEPYSRMVAPLAKTVGCAKVTCPSQAQIWACHYSQ
jgi:pathogenesis-related protein 1